MKILQSRSKKLVRFRCIKCMSQIELDDKEVDDFFRDKYCKTFMCPVCKKETQAKEWENVFVMDDGTEVTRN